MGSVWWNSKNIGHAFYLYLLWSEYSKKQESDEIMKRGSNEEIKQQRDEIMKR